MTSSKTILFASLILCSCAGSTSRPGDSDSIAANEPDGINIPYYNAFSHNDYAHERPLQEALELGFNCVEADCYLVNGKNVVAHDLPGDTAAFRYLEDLYLNPLFERIRENGGKVYPGADRPFYLMIDIKREGDEFYTALMPILESNSEMFCHVDSTGKYVEGPILLFFSGATPMATLPSQKGNRYAFLDGKFEDLGKDIPKVVMPVVSDNYEDFLTWNGIGEMPENELLKMRELIEKAHEENKLIRFWGAPDTEAWNRLQIREGVDIIGVDNLPQLITILKE